MTAQKAFHKILSEIGKPLPSKELARIALEQGYVTSNSKNPVQAIRTTVEKNIREGTYNSPPLVRIGRDIGLPSMGVAGNPEKRTQPNQNSGSRKRLSFEVSEKLMDALQLARQAKLGGSDDETFALLIQKGLSFYERRIRERIDRQLDCIRTSGNPDD